MKTLVKVGGPGLLLVWRDPFRSASRATAPSMSRTRWTAPARRSTRTGFTDGFGIHMGFGYLIWLLTLVFLVIGVAAGIGRWRLGRHGVLALLLTLQIVLAWVGSSVPAIGFFHPLNAVVILGLLVWIVNDTWRGGNRSLRRPPRRQQEP